MRTRLRIITLTGLLLVGAFAAHGQLMTEIYIPIGESPGLSATQTLIGEIVGRDGQARTVTIRSGAGERTVQLTERTHVYVDRSPIKQQNRYGTFEDCRTGRKAEVHFADPGTRLRAEWIKVQVTN